MTKHFYLLKNILFSSLAIFFSISGSAQETTSTKKITFEGDFRFRAEQDWDSRKSDGTFRDDRSRLRYRLRAGATYFYNEWIAVGARIRTGNPRKQQDPQLTLGDAFNEFGTLPIALEKAYFQWRKNGFTTWLGKNTFPFEKKNELFWSDNVYPEGVFLGKELFSPENEHGISLRSGHFIINSRGTSFDKDSYFQGFQVVTNFWNKKLQFYPGIYLFRNIQDIPDGAATFLFDYSIVHLGTSFQPITDCPISIELDYYRNIEDYESNDSISEAFKDEKMGCTLALGYGKLKNKNDWIAKATFTHLERYAAVDFLAQNDWARWDYSNFDSLDGRLTNLKGVELVLGYMLNDNLVLKTKYYWVEQLVPFGPTIENGQRIRFDIDIKL